MGFSIACCANHLGGNWELEVGMNGQQFKAWCGCLFLFCFFFSELLRDGLQL